MDLRLVLLMYAHICSNAGFLVTDGIQKVSTKFGDIVGFTDQVKFAGESYYVRKFLGIPYAEPPTGHLRFEKPVMKRHLQTPFKAYNYSSKCPQPFIDVDSMSEDCLYLNIFTPEVSVTKAAPKPVMIWIHGGAYFVGYADLFEGDTISAIGDVIVVTMNYRLGVLGFFSGHDSRSKGNYALWDQQLAIRWVYENIADFGGDVSNITIFGESAGASSVIYQMLYNGNKGLFQRAIAESGTIAAWAVSHGHTNYESSLAFARSLGCQRLQEMSVCLQGKSEKEIITAVLKTETGLVDEVNRTWVPVYDGEFVLAKTPDILSELNNASMQQKYSNFWDIDLMIGANNYDGVVYQDLTMAILNNTTPTSITYKISENQFNNVIVPRALEAWLDEKPSSLVENLVINEYTSWTDQTNETKRFKNAIDIWTDYALNAPTIVTANAHVNNKTSSYIYQFTASPPVHLMKIAPEVDGENVACHSDELFFVFGFNKPLRRYLNLSEDDVKDHYQLSKDVITMWTNFAKSGNPNIPRTTTTGTKWPAYDLPGENYLEIAANVSTVKQRLRAKQVYLWNKLLPEMQAFVKGAQ